MSDLEENKEASSLITLQLDIGEREFQSLDEMQEWMNQERSFFAWMETGSKNDGNAAHAWNATNQWFNFVQQYIQQSRQHQNNEAQLQNIEKNFKNQIVKQLKLIQMKLIYQSF